MSRHEFWKSQAFLIDRIVVANPPLVRSVTGCIDKFWPNERPRLGAAPNLDDRDAVSRMADAFHDENGFLRRGLARRTHVPFFNDSWAPGASGLLDRDERSVYAATFACPVRFPSRRRPRLRRPFRVA